MQYLSRCFYQKMHICKLLKMRIIYGSGLILNDDKDQIIATFVTSHL